MSVANLLEKVENLEARFGLRADGLAYSDRLLALIDALEQTGGEVPDETAPEPALDLAGQRDRLESMVGDAEPVVPEGRPETVEGAVASIETKVYDRRATDAWSTEEKIDFVVFQEKVRGTNINENTLLATDYLNHFNEIVMTLEMVPMMPEILEEAKEWKPKSYQEHFRDSGFSDKDLAVEAYEHVPGRFLGPFETTIAQMNALVESTITRLEAQLANAPEQLEETASTNSKIIQRLIDVASGIIHGAESTMDQGEIDSFIL